MYEKLLARWAEKDLESCWLSEVDEDTHKIFDVGPTARDSFVPD